MQKDNEAKHTKEKSARFKTGQVDHRSLSQLSSISPPELEAERRTKQTTAESCCATSLEKHHRRMQQFDDVTELLV